MMEGKDPEKKLTPRLKARQKMMDLLAHREYSELELRNKMQGHFDAPEIDEAIAFGCKKGWIAANPEARLQRAHEIAQGLHRKNKGQLFINQALEFKGLPALQPDPDRELEKARRLIENKFSPEELKDPSGQAKAVRLLISRGFDEDTTRDAIFRNL